MHPFAIIITFLSLLIPNLQTSQPVWLNNQQTIPNFPESLTFRASFGSVDPITEITLLYGVNQDTCGDVEAISYPRFTPSTQVNVEWTWDMRQSGSLPPGAHLWWQWQVTDQAGDVFTTERQETIWMDSLHAWQVVQSGPISLHYYYLDYSAALGLLDHAVFSLDQLTKQTGISTAQPIDLYIYGSTEDMQQAILYEPGWTGGLAYPEHNIVLIGISPSEIDWGKSTIAHELTHLLVGDYSFSCLGSLPTWLQEGLAVLGEGGPDSNSIVQFEEAKNSKSLISFKILSSGFSEDPDKANLSYSQSYYMVKYLVDTYGQEEISLLLKTLAKGMGLSEALQTVYGFSLEGFEEQWRSSIGIPLDRQSTGSTVATATSTIIPTIIPIQGIMTEQTESLLPTVTITPNYTPTPPAPIKTVPSDAQSIRTILICVTCLIGVSGIILLVVMISRGKRKKHTAAVVILFMLVSGIPWLSARGDQSTPTPYPILPTAAAYVPGEPESGIFYDPIDGIYLTLPAGVKQVPSEEGSGNLADFDIGNSSVFGLLFQSKLDLYTGLEQNAKTIAADSLTGLTEIQTVTSRKYKLSSGIDGWYSELYATNPDNSTRFFFGFLTVEGNISAITLATFSYPEIYDQYRPQIKALHDSIEIRQSSISGFDRSEVLILEGGETGNPRENDPATSHSGADNLVFSGLVTYNTRMELIPDLAEKWEVNPDRKTYIFYLDPTATFHNGRPVTAQDVIFSWERAANPVTGSDTVLTYLGDIVGVKEMRAGSADRIKGLKALDAHTLQVVIDQPKPYFLQKLTYPTAFIVDNENVALGEEWYRTPNGTGPFRLTRWESMTQKVYERFEGFYGDKPRIRAIIVNLYTGDSTRLYEAGVIDMTRIGTFEIDRFTDLNEPMHIELYNTPDLCTSYVTLDVTKPPFDILKVRQAFAMAIDKDLYIQLVYNNAALPASGLYPPALPGHDLSLKGWEYNPEKAREYLAQSGSTPETMPEIIFSSAGYGSSVSSSDSALIQMWEQNLGVKIKVQNIEPEYFLDNVLKDNTGQIYHDGWCADYPDPENFADVLFHTGAEMNTSQYSNPEVDSVLEQARTEENITSRIALYQEAERIIVEDVPAIFLSHSITYTLVKPYIQGYVEAPMVIPFERYLWIDTSRLPNQ